MKCLFTIGYANYSLEGFIAAIKQHLIDAVADVRSRPYSKYKPDFNRENLRVSLNAANIEYVFVGDLLGARVPDDSYYEDSRVVYSRVSESDFFKKGLNRIRNGLRRYTIALLCAEADPLNCHRDILVCRELRFEGISILHIVAEDQVETNEESETRLLKLFNLESNELFAGRAELIEEAYRRQGLQIAYSKQSDEEKDA